jgi:hypothetical protein
MTATNRDLLELVLLNELREVKRMKRMETDLIEQFGYAFNFVMNTVEREGLALPNYGAMLRCLGRIKNLMGELYPEASPAVKRFQPSPEDEDGILERPGNVYYWQAAAISDSIVNSKGR